MARAMKPFALLRHFRRGPRRGGENGAIFREMPLVQAVAEVFAGSDEFADGVWSGVGCHILAFFGLGLWWFVGSGIRVIHEAGIARLEQVRGVAPAEVRVIPFEAGIPIGGFHARMCKGLKMSRFPCWHTPPAPCTGRLPRWQSAFAPRTNRPGVWQPPRASCSKPLPDSGLPHAPRTHPVGHSAAPRAACTKPRTGRQTSLCMAAWPDCHWHPSFAPCKSRLPHWHPPPAPCTDAPAHADRAKFSASHLPKRQTPPVLDAPTLRRSDAPTLRRSDARVRPQQKASLGGPHSSRGEEDSGSNDRQPEMYAASSPAVAPHGSDVAGDLGAQGFEAGNFCSGRMKRRKETSRSRP